MNYVVKYENKKILFHIELGKERSPLEQGEK